MHRRRRVEQRLHDPPVLLDAVLAREARAVAAHRGVEQDLVRRRALAALVRELHVQRDPLGLDRLAALGVDDHPDAGRRVELDDDLVRLGRPWPRAPNPSRGGCRNTSRTSVWVAGRHLPVRMKNGTPDQRQLSISSRSAA